MKSSSDNSFFSFIKQLKTKGGLWKLGVLLAVGILLVVFGVFGSSGDKETETHYTDEEMRLAEFCSSLDGVGDCRVMIVYSSTGRYQSTQTRVESVSVICDGGGSVLVRQKLTELLSSLYGIGANRITVSK